MHIGCVMLCVRRDACHLIILLGFYMLGFQLRNSTYNLQLQVDADFSQSNNSKSSEAPSFNMHDFPALSTADNNDGMSKFNGEDLQLSSNTYRSPSNAYRGAIDFASTVRKLASQDSARRKYERNSSADGSIGSSRSSQLLTSSYNGNNKLAYGDKIRTSAAGRAAPVWLETGDAVGNTQVIYLCIFNITVLCLNMGLFIPENIFVSLR